MKRLAAVRGFPSDVQVQIARLGNQIDAMMAESGLLEILQDAKVRAEISRLGARLVNEVILVPGQITTLEAKTRLGQIEKDAQTTKSKFDQAGLALGERPWLASVESLRMIPKAQAQGLLSDFKQAFALYPALVDRYGKLRTAKDLASKLSPTLGAYGANLLEDLGNRLSETDRDLFWQKAAFDKLEADLAEAQENVQVDVSMYVRMANWPADLFRVDEGLKRLEGAVFQKRAEVTAPATESPWKTIALASGGLAAVGAVLYVVTKNL